MRNICQSCCTTKVVSVIFAALVVVLVGILVLSFVGLPLIINKMIRETVRLDENTKQWDRFVELPIPVIANIYLFNVSNAKEILQGEKPKLNEIGPYAYKQKFTKNILFATGNEDSVSYNRYTTPTFDPELSGGRNESDLVTVVNPALLVLTQITSELEQLVVVGCLPKIFPEKYYNLFITTTVEELVFKGFTFAHAGPDVGFACEIIRQQVIEKTRPMKNIAWIMDETDPTKVDHLKFSYLGYRIEKPDGQYTVNRGIHDVSKLGTIMRWNNETEMTYWGRTESINNDTCKTVRGGDSTLYPPQLKKGSSFEIFASDICRTVRVYYTKEDTYSGITGYRFETSNETFRPATTNVEQDCYCTQRTVNQNGVASCYLDGTFDLYDCFGAPLLLSFPHFLHADSSYINGVEGVTLPDKNIHGIYLLIEPNTGTPLKGRKRVQLNVILRPVKYIPFAATLASSVLPILWLDEGVDLPDDLVAELNDRFFNVMKVTTGAKYGLIAVSGAAVLIVGGIFVRKVILKW